MDAVKINKDNLSLIKVAMPLPLWTDHVNCFLLPGGDGWTIIDTGIYTPETAKLWYEVFRQNGIGLNDIRKILVTHVHMDHLGAAGFLQEITGAPIFISSGEMKKLEDIQKSGGMWAASPHYCFGLPESLLLQMEQDRLEKYEKWIYPVNSIESVDPELSVEAGNENFHLLFLGGHSESHICLYGEKTKFLLGGDVFVAPNYPASSVKNSLENYFGSMELLQGLEIVRMFPGHGKSFHRVNIRLGLIAKYRRMQLELTKDILCNGEETVYEVYRAFQKHGTIPEHYFGLGEVYFMLENLVDSGDARKKIINGTWFYYAEGS